MSNGSKKRKKALKGVEKMLNTFEKAYFSALQALRHKDYLKAADYFKQAAPQFTDNREFNLLYETTRLLLTVKEQLAAVDVDDDKIKIEETFSNG